MTAMHRSNQRTTHSSQQNSHNRRRTPAAAPSSNGSSRTSLHHDHSPASAALMHDRLVWLLTMLVGQYVVVTVRGGTRYSGILNCAPTDKNELSIALRLAYPLDSNSSDPPTKRTVLILAKDLLDIAADSVDVSRRQPVAPQSNLSSSTSAPDSGVWKTDLAISQKYNGQFEERQLQKWDGEETNELTGTLEDFQTHASRAWDQFSVNEAKFGATSDYQEDLYTTKIDRSAKGYKEREKRAIQVAHEILSSAPLNSHVAEERNLKSDVPLTEEDKYGAVIRDPKAYVPPSARKKAHEGALTARSTPVDDKSKASVNPPSKAPEIASALQKSGRDAVATSKDAKSKPEETADGTKPVKNENLVGDFRQFVASERDRFNAKKQQMQQMQQMQQKEKDSKLASFVDFSKNFKLPTPMPDEVAKLVVKRPSNSPTTQAPAQIPKPTQSRPAPAPSSAKQSTSSSSSSSSNQKPLPSSIPLKAPRFGISELATIPPFNPHNRRNIAERATNAPNASTDTGGNAKSPQNTPRFNPNASSFTPSPKPASKPQPKPATLNEFFGSKKPSSSKSGTTVLIKEDFTPFKNATLMSPNKVSPSWPYSGKSYRASLASGPSSRNSSHSPALRGMDAASPAGTQMSMPANSPKHNRPASLPQQPSNSIPPPAFAVYHQPYQQQMRYNVPGGQPQSASNHPQAHIAHIPAPTSQPQMIAYPSQAPPPHFIGQIAFSQPPSHMHVFSPVMYTGAPTRNGQVHVHPMQHQMQAAPRPGAPPSPMYFYAPTGVPPQFHAGMPPNGIPPHPMEQAPPPMASPHMHHRGGHR